MFSTGNMQASFCYRSSDQAESHILIMDRIPQDSGRLTMPTLVLLSGPNGAGKTTFINGYLREWAEAFQFVTSSPT
jgi:tRNA A37 threonylcarbamoyladenosine biosynthesis protein TsaE